MALYRGQSLKVKQMETTIFQDFPANEITEQVCKKALLQKYSAGLPIPVWERFEEELKYVKDTRSVEELKLAYHLIREADKEKKPLLFRGTITGSFLFFLLSHSRINPLKPHYYCSKCGYYEEPGINCFGIDLPSKICPDCGKQLEAEGFDIPIESVWGPLRSKPFYFEISITPDFYGNTESVIKAFYADNDVRRFEETDLSGFAVIPKGYLLDAGPDIHEDKNVKRIYLTFDDALVRIQELQKKTETSLYEIPTSELGRINYMDLENSGILDELFGELARRIEPRCFKDICSVLALCLNTYSSIHGYDPNPISKTESLCRMIGQEFYHKYPVYTLEDFFDCMIREGFAREIGAKFMDGIHYGAVGKGRLLKKYPELEGISLPDGLSQIANSFQHLWYRSEVVSRVLKAATLSWFRKRDTYRIPSVKTDSLRTP